MLVVEFVILLLASLALLFVEQGVAKDKLSMVVVILLGTLFGA